MSGHFTTFVTKVIKTTDGASGEASVAVEIKALPYHINRINLANQALGIDSVWSGEELFERLPTYIHDYLNQSSAVLSGDGSSHGECTISGSGELAEGVNYLRTRITVTDNQSCDFHWAPMPKPAFGGIKLYLPAEEHNRTQITPRIKSVAAKKASLDLLPAAKDHGAEEAIMVHEGVIAETSWTNFSGIKLRADGSWEWNFAPEDIRLDGCTEQFLIEMLREHYPQDVFNFRGIKVDELVSFDAFAVTNGIKIIKVVESITGVDGFELREPSEAVLGKLERLFNLMAY